MASIAIFASGRGSNAAAIINYFSARTDVNIDLILTNNSGAGVLSLAKNHDIPSVVVDKKLWIDSPGYLLTLLDTYKIDHIVLAGYLWLIPSYLISTFPNKIINIHPALLPNYGGKGMYGHHIHKAVSKSGDVQTGMTIHLVNEKYDDGKILFQKAINIKPHTVPEEIAATVLGLEHKYYPKVVDDWIKGDD